MGKQVQTYSLRGFLATAGVAALAGTIGGTVAFSTAPEVVTCGANAGRVNCELVRSLAGRVQLRSVTATDIDAVTIEAGDSGVVPGDPPVLNRTSYRLRLTGTESSTFSTRSDPADLENLRGQVGSLLSTRAGNTAPVILRGSPIAHMASLGFLLLGLALLPLWLLGYFFPALRPKQR